MKHHLLKNLIAKRYNPIVIKAPETMSAFESFTPSPGIKMVIKTPKAIVWQRPSKNLADSFFWSRVSSEPHGHFMNLE